MTDGRMGLEDQSEVVAFLANASTHEGLEVERIDTHSAIVFLAGRRALKLKRAVRFDYLDFSTAERRRDACEREVSINRRTAPSLYKGIVAITRGADGALALDGGGTAVDWAVEMERFDQDGLFDRLAAGGVLDLSLMEPLAAAVARLHLGAEHRPEHGGAAGMRWVVEGNARGFAQEGRGILDAERCATLTAAASARIERHAALLDQRRQAGYVRQCHGDLHLRNIVLLDGRPVLFDAIEFNDRIACVDVLYDLAFLLMDLWRRRLPRHANAVANTYLAETDDLEGPSLLPLFLSCRAAVRAKTSATTSAVQQAPERRREMAELAREYLEMALALLETPAPRLVATGGVSGSGKSTLALAIAPAVGAVPGAIVLRSDAIRKRLMGVSPRDPLGADAYTEETTTRVYDAMEARAGRLLRAGRSVVVDAACLRESDRARLEALAAAAGVLFQGLWLEAPEHVLLARVGQRTGDISDADAAVVRQQLAGRPQACGWTTLDAAAAPEAVLQQAQAALQTGTHESGR